MCHFGRQKNPRATRWILWPWKVEKTLWFCILFIERQCSYAITAVKGMPSSKISMWKGLLFVSRRYTEGVPFRSKMVYMNMYVGYMKLCWVPPVFRSVGLPFSPYLQFSILLVIVPYFCLGCMLFLLASCWML